MSPWLLRRLRVRTHGESVAHPPPSIQSDIPLLHARRLFPLIGSFVLFSMYLVFKFLDRKWVDRVLGAYFAVVGAAAVFKVVVSLFAFAMGPAKWKETRKYKVVVTHTLTDKEMEEEKKAREKERQERKKKGDDAKDDDEDDEIPRTRQLIRTRLSEWHLLLFLLALTPIVIFYTTRHWIASNTIALCLALNAVSLMGLDSFLTGSIMLGGLFVYDVFWVFGTEVMVSVARNFDAGPIKIIFPKNLPQVAAYYLGAEKSKTTLQSLLALVNAAPKWQMTMLGLGDIVIPGIFIALALRFDQHLYTRSLSATKLSAFRRSFTDFPKPYFTATLSAYVAGLATTMGVMHVFKAAQPALLYLSPACVLAVVLQGVKRGESRDLWTWTDGEKEEEAKEGEGEKSKKKGKAKKA